MIERTLAVIKPDAVLKGIVDQIKQRYIDAGLKIVREARYKMELDHALMLYRDHLGRPYFEGLVLAMVSGASVALVLEGENAIQVVRMMNGATDPNKADPGTIRYDFRSAGGPFNTVHSSDSPESAKREIAVAFGD